jgi:hypothetical protein
MGLIRDLKIKTEMHLIHIVCKKGPGCVYTSVIRGMKKRKPPTNINSPNNALGIIRSALEADRNREQ